MTQPLLVYVCCMAVIAHLNAVGQQLACYLLVTTCVSDSPDSGGQEGTVRGRAVG
jgi:hypothetical protein